jgi:hypothetical protein
MSKFAIGDWVEAISDHKGAVIVAVFSTVDGNFRYAIDVEGYGALQFVTEEKLVSYHNDEQAFESAGQRVNKGKPPEHESH